MSHLAVYLLSTPRIERDGVVVTVDTRKAVALLAFLALTHQHHSRDKLVALLWPDYDQSRDDFMAGFSLRDSPNFDDWQFFQGESLRRELAGALERLVAGYTAQGDFDEAIRAAALHQYRECVQVLEQELGVAPLETTTQLYQVIKENRPPPLPVQ